MRSFFATLRQLVIPAGAGPGTPQISLGPSIPPELQAWVSAVGTITLVAVIVYRRTATEYAWEGIGTAGGGATFRRWRGTYDTTHGVSVTQQTIISTASVITETFGNGFIATNQNIFINYLNVDVGHNGTSMPRTVKSYGASSVNSSAIGAEAVVLTAPGNLYAAGRVYRITFYGDTINTVASATVAYSVRQTNLAGAKVCASAYQMSATAGFSQNCTGIMHFTPTADFFDTFVLTLESLAGSSTMAGNTDQTRYIEIADVGSSANYPGVKTI